MLIYAIIKLLKVINIKSHENCSWLFFCAKKEENKKCYMKNLKKQLFKQYYEKAYLIKLHNKDVRQMIENADNKQFEGLLNKDEEIHILQADGYKQVVDWKAVG